MWAITTYFNFSGYKSKLKNYRYFHSKLNIPLLTVEFSLTGEFELSQEDADILIQIQGGAMLWQKERLLNFAIDALPSNVNNVAWIDCDILFANPNWHIEALEELQHQKIIQLFTYAMYLEKDELTANPNKEYRKVKSSIMGVTQENRKAYLSENEDSKNIDPLHPGFAWAAQRDFISGNKLYDKAIIGGGDSLLVCALFNEHDLLSDIFGFSENMKLNYTKWGDAIYESVKGRVGYISGDVYHLWHGDLKNRKYFQRYADMSNIGYFPDLDIAVNDNGAIAWNRERLDLEKYLQSYFAGRKEDE